MSEQTDTEVWYRGDATSTAGPHAVLVEDAAGREIGVLHHVVRHSPTGFSVSYAGSGPADLARSLLIAVLGDDAYCRTCEGTRLMTWDEESGREVPYDAEAHDAGETYTCGDCEKGGYRYLPYQDFKFAFVAGWGDSWRISRSEILAWLAEHDRKDDDR